ncbi:glycogen/starch/alpha-glucan phosphorylase [Anaeromicropila herbilytica]|uniref:Alpha-1,4 glucan phosphorylase n=1 Tax=Anaeromicropila herbilytica TaxID=2785025 RepID=A0A7R7EHK4_9FIRM|nr:glycogen/starch/alpha-glucan phosphorylase [Anaeromicropila herbilytica]BCN28850.1 glycosyl transferase family 35 [Anaeromicropila herbilytica]
MKVLNKDELRHSIEEYLKILYRKEVSEASRMQIYQALSYSIKDVIIDQWMSTHRAFEEKDVKTVYYLSMEFLLGRALGNNIISLKLDKVVNTVLEEIGIKLEDIEEEEPDPALGNGGLGRLAACFLDSLSTLGYAAVGCGIRYKYGMFKQVIENGFQIEVPDDWLKNGYPFEMKQDDLSVIVKFGGYVRITKDELGREKYIQENYSSVRAVPYDLPIVGYGNHIVNTLRIWDAEATNHFNLDSFDKGDYQKAVEDQNLARSICEVLYPNDSHYAGKELRLKQQYFFVSASIQRAVLKYMEKHEDIHKLPEKVVFQMNDTHPSVTVAELMRILLDDYNLSWEEAWEITTHSCAYTNHTIMSEALEKWPIDLFSKLLPRIYQLIEEINRRFLMNIKVQYNGDPNKIEKMAIIYNGHIRMANLAIVGSFSVNGVAELHTDILKKQQLRDFYEMTPDKFNNKTNGITQRRFLLHGNPLLSSFVTSRIGDKWITNLQHMKNLEEFAKDPKSQREFMEIKYQNKVRLAEYIKLHNGPEIDPNSIFDVQVKRLHEYKRQLLNIMHVMYLYEELKKNPNMDIVPRTFIFGAKASAGYHRAKAIIKLINSVGDVINNDKSINNKIKVVFIENYRVSNAEMIFAAADVSEQISTASKEASGTGNMKFMLNGALTLGTLDGANVEIAEEVGVENTFIFGLTADEVIHYELHGGYNPREIYDHDMGVQSIMKHMIEGYYDPINHDAFQDIYNSLLDSYQLDRADQYFILKDFRSYVEAQRKVQEAYKDKSWWAKTAILNVANCGKFSSDRTIEEYVKDIWKLEKVTL